MVVMADMSVKSKLKWVDSNQYMTSAKQQYPAIQTSFTRLALLGEGSFGKVYLAERLTPPPTHNENANTSNANNQVPTSEAFSEKEIAREFVALKKLKTYPRKKYTSPVIQKVEEYPEVAIMGSLSHPNLLALRGMVQRDKGFELSHYMVMDFGIELLEFARHKEVLVAREQVRCLVQQLVTAVNHLHTQGVMHRDIKPDNIYLMSDATLKLGDFSIATRTAQLAPPHHPAQEEKPERTGNVTTRHYRAPEIIYGCRNYDESIDIWSLGCTVAELLLGQTLFPGTTDIHQLELVFSVLGCPQDLWPDAAELPYYLEFDNSKQPSGLKAILPDVDPLLLHFLESTLQLDPRKRPSAAELLSHEYLQASTKAAREDLAKTCTYLHGKKLKEILKGKQ